MLWEIIRRYWPNVLALVAFGFAAAGYINLANLQGRVSQILLAFGGMVMVVASDEVSEWTGSYGWTRSQWRQYPTLYVKLGGAFLLGWSLYRLYQ
jgi:hypothetical protein